MMRYALALTLLVGFAGSAPAATWADGLLDSLSWDFGTVPRGPIVTHIFTVQNTTGQPLHIASVRVSCGCLSAAATQNDIAPGQSTTIVAKLDTNRFSGFWRKAMYVTFDQPQWAEVTVMVQAISRDDITFSPEALAFGRIRHGNTPDASVQVMLTGGNFKIVGAKSESDYVQPRVQEVRRDGGGATYQVSAHLTSDLPSGNWYTSIRVQTDNPAVPTMAIPLTVEVGPALTVTPRVTALGKVKKDAEVERKIIVRADQPFRIVQVKGADKQVRIVDSTSGSANVHRLVLTIRPTATGALNRAFQVFTDLRDEGPLEFQATAEVVP